MKRVVQKILVLLLVVTFLLPTSSFAKNVQEQPVGKDFDLDQVKALVQESALSQNAVGNKIEGDLVATDLNSTDEVRIIIELQSEPIIENATRSGVEVTELDPETVEALEDHLLTEQENVVNAIEAQKIDLEVHQHFVNAFNGFSATVQKDKISSIALNPTVKKVYLANEYERPEPQMSNSYQITQSKYVNDNYGLTGEGMVVAVIDTGIDYNHQDMKVDDGVAVALNEASVNNSVADSGLKGRFYTSKVPYGYNYMDGSDEIRDLGIAASMHGMHVSGTVAANGVIKGVAPNAQLLGLKVFGNDPQFQSTFGDVIMAAIDDAIQLGADVMNLSLGSTAAFVDENDPEQMAVARAVDNGIVMSISAGNSACFGSPYAPYSQNPDIGVVGSPGLANDSLQVASINNYTLLYKTKITASGFGESIVGYGKDKWPSEAVEVVSLGGAIGMAEDYNGIDVANKVVLVQRGVISFEEKTKCAAAAGAKAIIVYNNVPENLRDIYKDQGGWAIPFTMIINKEGLALKAFLDSLGGKALMDMEMLEEYVDPVAGFVSDFSSWGTTPTMDFKPEIAAPGGNIYSTLNDNTYGYMSGTSMAAPHVSGGAALVLERIETDEVFKNLALTAPEKAQLAKNILMNTATPVLDELNSSAYASPRVQGAGSMNLKYAIDTPVVVTALNTGEAKVNFGQFGTNSISFDLLVKNYSQETAVFEFDGVAQTNKGGNGMNLLTAQDLNATFSYSVDGVSCEKIESTPMSEKIVTVTISSFDTAYFEENFPNGNFLEGYVFFYIEDEDAANACNNAYKDVRIAYQNSYSKLIEMNEADQLAMAIIEQFNEKDKALTDKLGEKEAYIDSMKEAISAITVDQEVLDQATDAYNEAVLKYDGARDQYVHLMVHELEINYVKALYEQLDLVNAELAKNPNWIKKKILLERQRELLNKIAVTGLTREDVSLFEESLKQAQDALTSAQDEKTVAYEAFIEAQKGLSQEEKDLLTAYQTRLSLYDQEVLTIEADIATLNEAYEAASAKTNDLLAQYELLTVELNQYIDKYLAAVDAYNGIMPLSIPFIGFYGDWADAPLFDGSIYDSSTYWGITGLLDQDFNFLGIDVPSTIAISPNEDHFRDEAIPVFSLLRNAKEVNYQILDSNGQVIRTIGKSVDLRKNYFDSGASKQYYLFPNFEWDGQVKMKTVADGLYYYRWSGKIDGEDKVFTLDLPVTVDTKAPVVDSYDYTQGSSTFSMSVTDEGVGIEAYRLMDYSTETPTVLMTSSVPSFDLSTIEDKPYRVLPVAMDYAGNVGAYDNFIVINDDTLPEVRMDLEAFSVQDSRNLTVSGFVSDMTQPILYLNGEKVPVIYNQTTGLFHFEKDFTFSSDGKHAIEVRAIDAANNEIGFKRCFYIDSTAPIIQSYLKVGDINYVNHDIDKLVFEPVIIDNFPILEVKVNGDLVYYTEKDFISYADELKEIRHQLAERIPLDFGLNSIVVSAKDVVGHVTTKTFSVYRLLETEKIDAVPVVTTPSTSGSTPVDEPAQQTPAVTDLQDEPVPLGTPMFQTTAYISGYADGSFRPEGFITRAEVATIFDKVLTLEASTQATRFVDVSENNWAAKSIARIEQAGLIVGYIDGTFRAGHSITRGEMATVLSRAIDELGIKVDVKTARYSDLENHWSQSYVNKIDTFGIRLEKDQDRFRADDKLTRAEAVAMINQFVSRTITPEKYGVPSFTDVPSTYWAYNEIEAAHDSSK